MKKGVVKKLNSVKQIVRRTGGNFLVLLLVLESERAVYSLSLLLSGYIEWLLFLNKSRPFTKMDFELKQIKYTAQEKRRHTIRRIRAALELCLLKKQLIIENKQDNIKTVNDTMRAFLSLEDTKKLKDYNAVDDVPKKWFDLL